MREHKNNVLIRWVCSVLGVISLGIIGIVFYWLNYPYNVVDVYNEPMPVELLQPYPGGVVFVDFNYCKFGDYQGTLVRYLVMSDREARLPEQPEITHRNCSKLLRSPVLIPSTLIEKGKIYIRYEMTYSVNPMRNNFKETFRTQEFSLVSKP